MDSIKHFLVIPVGKGQRYEVLKTFQQSPLVVDSVVYVSPAAN
jgi:hypothetical protein